MAQVYLLSVTEPDDIRGQLEVNYLRHSASQDIFRQHTLVEDPENADLILFAEREGDLKRVCQHPLLRQFREKSFVVNPRYKGLPFVPGVYASVSRAYHDRRRTRPGHYPEVVENEFFSAQPFPQSPTYLFSFVGAVWTAPVRKQLAHLDHPHRFFLDTAPEGIDLKKTAQALAEGERTYIRRYVDICRQSAFVLCPRGTGPSSLRLFESMLLGRAPVIVSDDWVAPDGPDWGSFSLQVPEKEVARIPRLLEQHAAQAKVMGQQARKTWEDWFSETVTFHHTVEKCLEIQRRRPLPESVLRYWCYAQVLQPGYLRKVYRTEVLGRIRTLARAVSHAGQQPARDVAIRARPTTRIEP